MDTITPHSFGNLGALDKPIDTRDIKLGTAVAVLHLKPVYTYPKERTNGDAWAAPVEYQGQEPACGSHSGSKLRGIQKKDRYTPRFTWADIKSFDGIVPEQGTDMRSIFKSITKAGTLPFDVMGNDVTLPLDAYTHPVIVNAMRALALKTSGDGYGFIQDLTWEGLKQFIFDHGPTIILMRVGASLYTAPDGTTSWAEKDILPLRPPTPITSGHFVVAHSYDEQNIYFINSFGDTWGRKGHGYFSANYMPFVNDAGALFPLSFTYDLSEGMTDPDIKRLQVILNKDPRTQVAVSGNGAPGHETEVFGSLTLRAVQKFQGLYGITPAAGYVGPLTRAVLNGFV